MREHLSVTNDKGTGSNTLIIQPEAIDALREIDESGSGELISELVHLFITTTEEKLSKIKGALVATDLDRVAREAHQLKSSSANLGAIDFSALATQIERGALAKKASEVESLFKRLEGDFPAVKSALEVISHEAKK